MPFLRLKVGGQREGRGKQRDRETERQRDRETERRALPRAWEVA
jgi:hypothetical protein